MAEGVLALLALEEWRSEHTHSYDNGEFGRLSMSVCMMMSLKDVILHSLSLSLIDPFSPFRSTTGGRLNVDLQRKVPLNFNGSSKRGFSIGSLPIYVSHHNPLCTTLSIHK